MDQVIEGFLSNALKKHKAEKEYKSKEDYITAAKVGNVMAAWRLIDTDKTRWGKSTGVAELRKLYVPYFTDRGDSLGIKLNEEIQDYDNAHNAESSIYCDDEIEVYRAGSFGKMEKGNDISYYVASFQIIDENATDYYNPKLFAIAKKYFAPVMRDLQAKVTGWLPYAKVEFATMDVEGYPAAAIIVRLPSTQVLADAKTIIAKYEEPATEGAVGVAFVALVGIPLIAAATADAVDKKAVKTDTIGAFHLYAVPDAKVAELEKICETLNEFPQNPNPRYKDEKVAYKAMKESISAYKSLLKGCTKLAFFNGSDKKVISTIAMMYPWFNRGIVKSSDRKKAISDTSKYLAEVTPRWGDKEIRVLARFLRGLQDEESMKMTLVIAY